jgi:Ca2+-dependent lipid-binding protein
VSKRRNIVKGTLRLRIREGKNMPRMDDIGLSDPYVVVKAFGQEKRTQVMEVTLNLVWEEEPDPKP